MSLIQMPDRKGRGRPLQTNDLTWFVRQARSKTRWNLWRLYTDGHNKGTLDCTELSLETQMAPYPEGSL